MSQNIHVSVRKNDAIKYLNLKQDGIYVDCTFGRGGHSSEIINQLGNKGLLISIDKDIEAFNYFKNNFKQLKNHIFVNDSFSNLEKILNDLKIEAVDGFLFDFGVSSPMFDDPSRGFSYRLDGPLDMRMNQNQELDAKFIVNNYNEKQLTHIFKAYGDIKNPFYVVKGIIETRKNQEISTTFQLVEIIRKNINKKELNQKKHFARQYFQAIRMEVNQELKEINIAIEVSLKRLKPKGRVVTISFHSLEEKEVKNVFNKFKKNLYPKELPINNPENEYKIINIKDKWANQDEINFNNRSRSSLLKVIERE